MMGIYDMAQYTINSQLDSVVDKINDTSGWPKTEYTISDKGTKRIHDFIIVFWKNHLPELQKVFYESPYHRRPFVMLCAYSFADSYKFRKITFRKFPMPYGILLTSRDFGTVRHGDRF